MNGRLCVSPDKSTSSTQSVTTNEPSTVRVPSRRYQLEMESERSSALSGPHQTLQHRPLAAHRAREPEPGQMRGHDEGERDEQSRRETATRLPGA